jgi:hypothetical protein
MIEVVWTAEVFVVIDDATTSDPDGRTDIGTTVSIYFHCIWSTNGSSITSGTLSVNSSLYAIDGTGWVELTHSSPSVLRYVWEVDGANVSGVTKFDMRASQPEMIWDALSVSLSVRGGDIRINVNDPVTIDADITYIYDGSVCDATADLNSSTFQYSDVGQRGYSVVGVSGDSYGISVVANANSVAVVWDALVIDVFVLDNHLDVDTIAVVGATATYAFDGTDYDGNLNLNDSVFALTLPGRRGYTVVSAAGDDTHGIDAISTNTETWCIWDQVEVFRSEPENERSDLDTDVEARFWVRYGYDNAPYTATDGLLSVNGTQATYSSTGGYWSILVSHSSVGSYLYVVNDFNDGDLSTLVGAEDYGCHVIFDRVYVSSSGATFEGEEGRPPDILDAQLGRSATVYFVLRYEFDGSFVTDPDTLLIVNGRPAEYNDENDRWELTVTSNAEGPVEYVIDEFEDSYGLTGIDQRGEVPRISWKPIDISGLLPYILIGGAAISVVLVFARRTLRRVARLEEALTPEELLILQEAGMPREMQQETIANLEWLKELPGEISNMPPEVLTLLWEELVKARSMYERAFALRPADREAGETLRNLLLDRIEMTIAMIDNEIQSRNGT